MVASVAPPQWCRCGAPAQGMVVDLAGDTDAEPACCVCGNAMARDAHDSGYEEVVFTTRCKTASDVVANLDALRQEHGWKP